MIDSVCNDYKSQESTLQRVKEKGRRVTFFGDGTEVSESIAVDVDELVLW